MKKALWVEATVRTCHRRRPTCTTCGSMLTMDVTVRSFACSITMEMMMRTSLTTSWGRISRGENNALYAGLMRCPISIRYGNLNINGERLWRWPQESRHSSPSWARMATLLRTHRTTLCSSSRTSPTQWLETRDVNMVKFYWRRCHTLVLWGSQRPCEADLGRKT